VPDARHWGPGSDASPAIYRLFGPDTIREGSVHGFTVVVRPRPGARNLAAQLREAAESIGTPVVVDGVRTGSAWLGDRIDTQRRRTVLLNLLGGLGLLLAVVGVLGVTSYAVGRRAQEIGIRLALGARPGDVVRRVLRDSLWPVAIGVVAGTGAALLSTRVIRTFLFETSPIDAVTLALVAAALLAVGGLAAWIPARRAARIDPATALRAE
jgi:ABC-type antimicrobial peptide transport system permease subunit